MPIYNVRRIAIGTLNVLVKADSPADAVGILAVKMWKAVRPPRRPITDTYEVWDTAKARETVKFFEATVNSEEDVIVTAENPEADESDFAPALIQNREDGTGYELTAQGCWIDVGNLTVHLVRTSDELIVDVHQRGREQDPAIDFALVYFDEVKEV